MWILNQLSTWSLFCLCLLIRNANIEPNINLISLRVQNTGDHPPLQRLQFLQSKGFPQKIALLNCWRLQLQSQELSRVFLVKHFTWLFLNFYIFSHWTQSYCNYWFLSFASVNIWMSMFFSRSDCCGISIASFQSQNSSCQTFSLHISELRKFQVDNRGKANMS